MKESSRAVRLLGVRVDDVSMDQAVERIAGLIEQGGAHHVTTVNPEFVMTARQNPEFARVLNASDLAVPDGVGLALAARWTGQELRGRVPGVELVERVAALCARRGWRIFFLGAAPGVAADAAAVLLRRYPELTIAGCYAGSPRVEDEPALRERIRAAHAHVLLVAFGSPTQDLWIARNQPSLQVPLAIGVGGTFDYLSGRVRRAPAWMRRLGLEWLFRLVRQPWRWKRIWTAVVRFPLAVRRAHRQPT